jgi:hypothetical protein
MCWPDRVVERDCRVNNALAGFILALGPAVEYVLPGDFRDLQCDLIIDKPPITDYRLDQYTAADREYAMEAN